MSEARRILEAILLGKLWLRLGRRIRVTGVRNVGTILRELI